MFGCALLGSSQIIPERRVAGRPGRGYFVVRAKEFPPFGYGYEKPEIRINKPPRAYCPTCVNGWGIAICPTCWNEGVIPTKPGGAGVPGIVGFARCWQCKGMGKIPCYQCAGYRIRVRPPRDPRLDFAREEVEKEREEIRKKEAKRQRKRQLKGLV